jgi:hypothetical protein
MWRIAFSPRAAAVYLVAATLVAACGGQARHAGTSAERCSEFRIDAARWARASDDEEDQDGLTERQRLADRIVACKTLTGMSAAEVRRIFGAPDERGERDVEYLVGAERGAVRLDGEYLHIAFDRDDVVVDVQLTT